MSNRIERLLTAFEAGLWSTRLLVLAAVVACLLVFVTVLGIACFDAVVVVSDLAIYPTLDAAGRDAMRVALTGDGVKVLDMFLLAVMMLIAAMGLYELFISRINVIEDSDLAQRLLLIRNLDDLKSRLAALVLLKLMVKLFQQALAFHYETSLDLLVLGACVLAVGLATWLASRAHTATGAH